VVGRLSIFHLRQRSLVRALVLSLGAFAVSLRLAGLPDVHNLHRSYGQFAALLVEMWGMAETARCLRRRWSLYHAGILILLYSNLMMMAATVALFVLW
jgi:hypothetical protein